VNYAFLYCAYKKTFKAADLEVTGLGMGAVMGTLGAIARSLTAGRSITTTSQ